MEKQINRSLLNKLFENPTPLEDKKDAFNILFNRLFPDKSAFRFFLSTNNYDEQIRVSKLIIQRLCFESNYPPAYDLLINLLKYENTDENKAQSRSYTPQDHFVHIVNSYIFGVFLYFYHPTLSSILTKYFIGARKREVNINPVLNATKDFISFWKYFCLFHDVAYPIEGAFRYKYDKTTGDIFKDEDRKNKMSIEKKGNEHLKYIEVFKNIPSLNIKEWSATAVARFLTVLDLFYDSSNKTVDELFLNNKAIYSLHSSRGTLNPFDFTFISNIVKDYVCIDKLLSFEHFKLLSGFIKPEDTLFVIVDRHTLIPVAFKHFKDKNEEIYIISQSRYFDKADIDIIDSIFECEEDYSSSRFSVKFCIKDPLQKIQAIIPPWGSSPFTKDEIDEIRSVFSKDSTDNGLVSDSSVRFTNITDASELDDYSFGIFRRVFNYLGTEFIENSNISVFKQIVSIGTATKFQEKLRNSIIKSEISKIPQYLSEILCKRFFSEINNQAQLTFNTFLAQNQNDTEQNDESDIFKSLSFSDSESEQGAESPCNTFAAFFQPLINNILAHVCAISNDQENLSFAESLYKKMQDNIDLQNHGDSSTIQFLSEFLLKIYNPISNPDSGLCKRFFGNLGDKSWKSLPFVSQIGIQEESKLIISSIVEIVEKISSGELSADDLCKEYMNPYFALDHGIWGGYVYLISELITYNSIIALFTNSQPEDRNLASSIPYFIWPISNSYSYDIKLQSNYDLISKETAKAIFVHNIYDTYIRQIPNKKASWNIDLYTEPCVFFALLVDALQKWDRKQYFSPEIDYRSLYEADSFDIQIEGKKLRISMRCHSRDIETIHSKFRKALDSYLSGASDLIELAFV